MSKRSQVIQSNEAWSPKTLVNKVNICTVRKTKPTGPMTVCSDMYCFDECVARMKRENGIEDD